MTVPPFLYQVPSCARSPGEVLPDRVHYNDLDGPIVWLWSIDTYTLLQLSHAMKSLIQNMYWFTVTTSLFYCITGYSLRNHNGLFLTTYEYNCINTVELLLLTLYLTLLPETLLLGFSRIIGGLQEQKREQKREQKWQEWPFSTYPVENDSLDITCYYDISLDITCYYDILW